MDSSEFPRTDNRGISKDFVGCANDEEIRVYRPTADSRIMKEMVELNKTIEQVEHHIEEECYLAHAEPGHIQQQRANGIQEKCRRFMLYQEREAEYQNGDKRGAVQLTTAGNAQMPSGNLHERIIDFIHVRTTIEGAQVKDSEPVTTDLSKCNLKKVDSKDLHRVLGERARRCTGTSLRSFSSKDVKMELEVE